MKIEIDKDYYIKTDPYQYMLMRKTHTKRKGRSGGIVDGEDVEGFFGTIEDALKVYIKRKINDDKSVTSIQGYIDKIKEMLNFELVTIKVNVR